MARNPFQYLQSVTPEAFVGRWPLVKHIADDLAHEQGDSHAIIAGQRCGKTSLLLALAQQLRQQAQQESGDYRALPLYIDFKAGSFDSAEAVFAFILNRVYRQINVMMHDHSAQRWPMPLRQGNRWFEQLVNAPTLTQHDFEEGLSYLLDQLTTSIMPVRLVLLLDGIDQSLGQPWTETLYSQARTLICSSDLSTRLRLVLTSSPRLVDRSIDNASLCNVLRLHYLEPLDQTGFDQLMAQVAELPVATAQMIKQQSGGHPFLAQYLLAYLWEQTQANGIHNANPGLLDRGVSLFRHTRGFEFEGWANNVGATGLDIYRVLSRTTEWVTEHEIIAAVDAPVQQIKRGLLALCCQGLAIQDEDWVRYRCTGDLFKTWFNQCGATASICRKQEPPKSDLGSSGHQISIRVDTGGGPYIAGDVSTQGGGFIGRDTIEAMPEQ
jgi:hypothetical protein